LLLSTILCYQVQAARFWVATTSSNWSNPANWATSSGGAGGASVPGAADPVTFDNNGTGNCFIDIPVNILRITVSATYTGTITQGSFSFSTVNTATFSGGTFTGGSGNIVFANNFTLNGANFTSTSAVLEFDGNSAFTSGPFNHNNGSVRYVATGGATAITGVSPTFYNLEFSGQGFSYNINSTGDMTVINNLNLTGSLFYNLNSGIIDVNGNINVMNTAAGCAGSALINIVGAGSQNFVGSTVAGQGALPRVTINKPSGTLFLTNNPASSNAFTYTAGTVNAGVSTWCFTDGTANPYAITGSLPLNNITFVSNTNGTYTIPTGTTLTTTGDLTIAGTSNVTLNTGNINVSGNLYLTNTASGGGGSAVITLNGSGNQTIDGTAIAISQSLLPYLVIDKSGGTLTLKGNISESQDWTYLQGTVDASTFLSTVVFGGNGLNVTSAGMSFYNVAVTGNTVTLLSSMTIGNNLNITAGKLSPGSNTLNIAGNWSNYSTTGFTQATSPVIFNGSTLQTISNPAGEIFTFLTINNTGPGIKLLGNVTAGSALTMTKGNIDLNGNTLTTGLSVANNGTLNYTSGTIINTGSFIRWFKAAAIAGNTGLFPVGTAANYRPLIITSTTNPTGGGTITVSYTDATTNTSVLFADGASFVTIRKDLHWAVSEANGLTGGTYSLQAQGTGFGTIGSVADLRLTLANGVVATAGINGGTTSNPQVNRTGLTLANLNNTFYIGSVNPVFTTLPLDLIYFNGSLKDGKVTLDWASALDKSGDRFIVQRSKDGSSWEDLQQLAADSPDDATHYYSAQDPAPYPGVSFYRLHHEDADGNSAYSSILSFKRDDPSARIVISPVPATDHLTVSFPGAGKYTVLLLNVIGQPVKEPLSSTGYSLTWQVSALPAGTYFVQISRDGIMETRTVLVRR